MIVRVQGLHKRFGHLEVLKGIDMELHQGEVVVIFGRSGSGKSTLLRCVNFLEDPTEGTIEVAGFRLGGGHRTRRKREQIRRLRVHVGMVFQQFNLFPHMTVLQNVMAAPLCVKNRDEDACRKQAVELLDQVGLADKAGGAPDPAVRRPAAAGGDRAGARDEPRGHAVRRADVGARPRADR